MNMPISRLEASFVELRDVVEKRYPNDKWLQRELGRMHELFASYYQPAPDAWENTWKNARDDLRFRPPPHR